MAANAIAAIHPVRPPRSIVALAAVLVLSIGTARRAEAQATNLIHVTTTVQGDSRGQGPGGGPLCSLAEAIYAANSHTNEALDASATLYTSGCETGTGDDTIVLSDAVYKMTDFVHAIQQSRYGPTATPVIFSHITVQGNGATIQLVPGSPNMRAFSVGYDQVDLSTGGTPNVVSGWGNLTLQNVVIEGFTVKGGDGGFGAGGGLGAGGAIYVDGSGSSNVGLTVVNSTFESNGATGGNGGHVILAGAAGGGGGGLAGNGGNGGDVGDLLLGGGGGGGSFGDGGAGFSSDGGGGGGGGGTDSSGQASTGVTGGGAGFCGGTGGNGGAGTTFGGGSGGNDASCPGGGGGGGGAATRDSSSNGGSGGKGNYGGGGGGAGRDHNNGGDGGFGGGGGAPTGCEGCILAGNSHGGNGGFGGGGGANSGTLQSNGVGGRFGGDGAVGKGGGGGGALGGAIFSDSSTVVIQNSTFFNNFVDRGTGGGGADNGADAGGAIFVRDGSLTVQDVTISGNQATGSGGGILVVNDGSATSFTLQNTIIAGNGAQECLFLGPVTISGTHNLIQNNFGCPDATVIGLDPNLGLLQLNPPGDTPTRALQTGSPAIGAADASLNATLPTDQRGVTRKATPDIGAYETPPPAADLSITKTVSSAAAMPGDTVTYTLVIVNKGPNDANSVTVTDDLPSSLTFISCSESTGSGTCTFGGGAVTVAYATLANGAMSTVTVNATLNFGVADGSTVTNTASVTSTIFDPNLGNNSGTASFTAQNNSDLYVTQSATKLTNRQLKYTINVRNLGKYLAKQLVLNDAVPSGSYLISVTPGPWSCSAPAVGSTGTISCKLATEAVGATQTITFVAKVKAPGSVLINNTASVSAATFDPNLANNTATLVSKVGP
jgi:uncharacterized repeat protein (TIGR01451 family)